MILSKETSPNRGVQSPAFNQFSVLYHWAAFPLTIRAALIIRYKVQAALRNKEKEPTLEPMGGDQLGEGTTAWPGRRQPGPRASPLGASH